MEPDITTIGAFASATVIILGAVFAGMLKLIRELRKILNSSATERAIQSAERHGEIRAELATMSDGIKSLGNHSGEHLELLKEIAGKLP
jgi:aspartokinase-like uncharacterized kinase